MKSKRRSYFAWAFFFLLFLQPIAKAKRSVIAPPYEFRFAGDFPTAAHNQGYYLIAAVSLINLSPVVQNGFIRLKSGSTGYARCLSPGGVYHSFQSYFFAASIACNVSPLTSDVSGVIKLTATQSIPFSVPAGDSLRSHVGAFFAGTAPFTNGAHGCGSVDSYLSPVIEVEVTEDAGALLGSVSPSMTTAQPCSIGAQNVCGNDVTAYCDSSFTNAISIASVPLMLNGGRAF